MQNMRTEENSSVAQFSEFSAERVGERHNTAGRHKFEPAATRLAIQKEYLPRRSGEPRFAPPQYVYSASPGGVLPTAPATNSPNTRAA